MSFSPIIALIITLSVFTSEARAQLYEYTDKSGNLIFSDNPPADVSAKVKHLKEDGVYRSTQSTLDYPSSKSARESTSNQNQEQKRALDFSRVTVVMYMTDWCGYCKKARQYINSLGASLIEYNIDRDQSKKEEMRKKSGGSTAVPLIDIDGAIIHGYREADIRAALNRSAVR